MHPPPYTSLAILALATAAHSTLSVANDTLTITGAAPEQSQAELDQIAGGTNLITLQQQERLTTLRDALDYQPGLVIQEYFGGIDQPRLNIRGSGIQSNPVNRGVLLMEDGIPLNEADGSFVIGMLEPRDATSIVVKRGANAHEPGATTLGGSLDFIPQYGSNSRNIAGLEAGSFGRVAGYGSLNTSQENSDAHLHVSADSADGFRNHSTSQRRALRSNIGWQLGEAVFNRFYLNYTDLSFDVPFALPKARVSSAPNSVMGDGTTPQDNLLSVYKRDPHREAEQFRLANRTEFRTSNNSSHTVGIYLQETDDSMVDILTHADTESQTSGLQWQYDTLIDNTDIQLAASWTQSDMQRDYFTNNPTNGSKLQRFGDLDMEAQNGNLGIRINHPLSNSLSLDAQLRWNRSCRDVINLLNNTQLDQCWNGSNAKLGLNLRSSENHRWFANISTSHEAPTFWEIIATRVAPNNPASAQLTLTELELQQAVTLEIGGQGKWIKGHHWDFVIYRSKVEEELISSANMVGGRGSTSNYGNDTIHQGIELGLRGGEQLHYRLAWNYSDFTFDGGLYDGNRIGGIPEHQVSAELGYNLNTWTLSANLHWMPNDTAADHVNSLYQDDYAIWGLQADYRPVSDGWRAFIKVDNLTDEAYASAFAIRNQSSASQPTFLPGNGRSISAGIKLLF